MERESNRVLRVTSTIYANVGRLLFMPHFRCMRRKAVSFRSIEWNGSDNLRAEKRRYRRLSLSGSAMKPWFTPPRDGFTLTARFRRETYLMRSISGDGGEAGGRRDGRDTVQAHWIGSLRQLRPSRLVSGSASWRPRYYVGETAKISNVPFRLLLLPFLDEPSLSDRR